MLYPFFSDLFLYISHVLCVFSDAFLDPEMRIHLRHGVAGMSHFCLQTNRRSVVSIVDQESSAVANSMPIVCNMLPHQGSQIKQNCII
jgi:hypothetical protein